MKFDDDALRASAEKLGIPLTEGTVHSSDVFYRETDGSRPAYWERLRRQKKNSAPGTE